MTTLIHNSIQSTSTR